MTTSPPVPSGPDTPVRDLGAAGVRPPHGAVRTVTITAGILGAIIMIGTGGISALAAQQQFREVSVAHSVELDVTGVNELVLDGAAGDVTVRFADISEALLEVSGTSARGLWEMDRVGNTLLVSAPRPWFGFWFGGVWDEPVAVTVTLPEELADGTLDARLSVSAGGLSAQGDFADLRLEVNAGQMSVQGSAQSVTAEVNAGQMTLLDLVDVDDIDLSISAGRAEAVFSGSAPREVRLDVSAGAMDVSLPAVEYLISADVTGGFDNRVQGAQDSDHRIFVEVAAGSLTLRETPARSR